MTCVGVVRNRRIELPEGIQLPEGQEVQIQLPADDWHAQWDRLVDEVTESWKSAKSALEILYEGRR